MIKTDTDALNPVISNYGNANTAVLNPVISHYDNDKHCCLKSGNLPL